MKEYIVTAVCTVPYDELNYNDKDWYLVITTPYLVSAKNEDGALDNYHETVPIKVLDNFDINVTIL